MLENGLHRKSPRCHERAVRSMREDMRVRDSVIQSTTTRGIMENRRTANYRDIFITQTIVRETHKHRTTGIARWRGTHQLGILALL